MAATRHAVNSRRWPGVYAYTSDKKKVRGKPDLCYYINYRLDGKLKWEKVGWKSEGYIPQVAAEIRADRLRTARHGNRVKTDKEIRREKRKHDRTVNEIKEKYFNSERGRKLKGRRTDLNRYDLHLKASVGCKRVSKLSQFDIERIRVSMKGHAPATLSNTLELLRRLINYGVKHSLCPSLPFSIDLPKKNNEVTEYLTPEEAARFLDVLESWPNQDISRMLKLAMFTGMRRGEIFNLQVNDLDFHQELIYLRDPKGGKDVSIPMSSLVRSFLKEQLAWCKERHLDSLYVFPAHHGGRRSDSSAVNRIKKKANLPKSFRIFHGLRHHLGVTLANSGEYTLDMIGELLTHKSTVITKRYAQFLPETKKRAADRAADLLKAKAASKKKVVNMENYLDE